MDRGIRKRPKPVVRMQALAIWLVVISPFVGSFLGVLVTRLPEGRSVVWGRSRCAVCGTRLGVRDLIPVASFLWLGGRCRHCGAPLPRRLLLAEGLAVCAALIAVMVATGPAELVLAALWLWLLIPLAVIDATHYRLPDALTAALFVVGVPLGLLTPGAGLPEVLLSAGLGVGALAVIRLGYRRVRGREGLGAGDVKLMAGIGAALPPEALPWVTLVAAVLALAAVLLVPGWRRRAHAAAPLPFGTFLCVAAALTWLSIGRV